MEDDRPEQPGVVGGDIEDIAVGVGEEPMEQPEEEPQQEEEEEPQQEEEEEPQQEEEEEPQQEEEEEPQQEEEDEQQEGEDEQQQQQQQEEDISFPKSLLKRLVKEQMDQEVCKSKEGAVVDVQVNKDSLVAFDVAAKLFIHYLTCAANDLCIEAKRQTLGVQDVFQGLEDTEFGEFVEPLRAHFVAFKESKKKGKRKSEDVGVPDDVHKSPKTDNDGAE
ncbi:DNA polymerase epsilon subunit 3 [Picochlorum sp. SENEW3]|nr:DNA polymerase epsilon subunit 3 [Picochlorum sp. SENEW3]WPT18627.1 DNA polymerase epsilon subunit 3 [Picochlorum sp. SENEW3]